MAKWKKQAYLYIQNSSNFDTQGLVRGETPKTPKAKVRDEIDQCEVERKFSDSLSYS